MRLSFWKESPKRTEPFDKRDDTYLRIICTMKNNEGFIFIGDFVEEVKDFNKVTNHILSFIHASISIENDWREGQKMNCEPLKRAEVHAKIEAGEFSNLSGISKVSGRPNASSVRSSKRCWLDFRAIESS
jgi:hypothetical protein